MQHFPLQRTSSVSDVHLQNEFLLRKVLKMHNNFLWFYNFTTLKQPYFCAGKANGFLL